LCSIGADEERRTLVSKVGRRKLIGGACWVATLVVMAISGALAASSGEIGDNEATSPLLLGIILAYATVGLLLVLKVPDNRIGWIFSLGGLLASIWVTTQTYSEMTQTTGEPALGYVMSLNQVVYFPMILCLVALPLLLFPDGEVPSPAWRWVWWPVLGLAALAVLSGLFQPEFTQEVAGEVVQRVDNPFGIDAWAAFFDSTVGNLLGAALIVVGLLAPVAAMIYRVRRSDGVERLQLKWLAFSATFAAVGLTAVYIAQAWVPESSPWLQLLTAVGLLGVFGIPITAGLAITRYHLYDIDRLISRTITYGLLAGLLGAVYALGVFLLGSFAFAGEIQVVISTLAVAALFNPLRRRLQAVLDRRFSRSAFASQQVLAEFSHLIRDEVDTSTLVGDLLRIVDATLAPSRRAIWIREEPI
jgi:hypothetical protein